MRAACVISGHIALWPLLTGVFRALTKNCPNVLASGVGVALYVQPTRL